MAWSWADLGILVWGWCNEFGKNVKVHGRVHEPEASLASCSGSGGEQTVYTIKAM